MGLFAYIKNGTKYKMNQFPGAYPANRVSYNGSDVETALNELNADITSKVVTSEVDLKAVAKPYFFPKDGYIDLIAPAGGYVALNVKDANNSNLIGFRINATSTDYAQSSIFIRKGLRCNDAPGSSGSSVTYRAL